MTTAPDHHMHPGAEPLSDEERDLAARLGRIGAAEGPSPALDARILAAAHAAAVPRRPGRGRLAWLGVPPALVTGAGVAAAAALALGLVWQLRPQYGDRPARSEADASDEVILIAPPSDAAMPQVAEAPPPMAESPASAPASVARTSPAREAKAAAQTTSKAVAPAPAAASAPPATDPGTPAAFANEEARAADAAADAPAQEEGFVAEPSDAASARHATYTTAARAMAERRERAAAQRAAEAASAEESAMLDRIEVTGTRVQANPEVDWSQVPVDNDSHLSSIEWLERIRERRDAGDTEHARESLRLFQREYPRIRLPDDLRALLAETKR